MRAEADAHHKLHYRRARWSEASPKIALRSALTCSDTIADARDRRLLLSNFRSVLSERAKSPSWVERKANSIDRTEISSEVAKSSAWL